MNVSIKTWLANTVRYTPNAYCFDKYYYLYRYLVTCTDYFTKWPEAQPLTSKYDEGVAHFLLSLITRFGCFQECISDQGREFVNSLNEKFFEMAGIEHRVASAYHPQTIDERMNQAVTKALVKYINSTQDDWNEHIEPILFSYRTSIHASTNYTPFYLMYGREAVLPVQLELNGSQKEESKPCGEDFVHKYAAQFEKDRANLFPKVDLNIKKAQVKQKSHYDQRHASAKYHLGDLVLLKKHEKSQSCWWKDG